MFSLVISLFHYKILLSSWVSYEEDSSCLMTMVSIMGVQSLVGHLGLSHLPIIEKFMCEVVQDLSMDYNCYYTTFVRLLLKNSLVFPLAQFYLLEGILYYSRKAIVKAEGAIPLTESLKLNFDPYHLDIPNRGVFL